MSLADYPIKGISSKPSKEWWSVTLSLMLTVYVCGALPMATLAEDRIRYDDGPLTMPGAEFVLEGNSWLPRTDLTYGFISTTPDLGIVKTKAAVEQALALWAAVTPLTFMETLDCGLIFEAPSCVVPDIRIQFQAGSHGDPFPFDGPLGVLAHAFYPPPNGVTAAGDAHFDEAELRSAEHTSELQS